jgi:4-hydroxy-tetrahydrodipicolinate reductase
MNLLLVGYGKMGKIVEQTALRRGHTIAGRIDVDNNNELDRATADVAIEFSHPDAAFDNVRRCIERGIPVVCGTTGWLSRKGEIEKLVSERNGTFFYASNFSLGVNIFFKVNEYLARMMNSFPEYEISLDEVHHSEKKDAPSGTAITLAEGILRNVERKKKWTLGSGNAEDIAITAFRIDQIPGTHVVKYASRIDDIEIKHTAHSREGFALGAVMVAEWILDKKGCLTMDDYLKIL